MADGAVLRGREAGVVAEAEGAGQYGPIASAVAVRTIPATPVLALRGAAHLTSKP